MTTAAFWKVQHNGFVIYDDGVYVTENRHVQLGLTAEAIRWAFTTTHGANWHPLTWLSHMLDCRLYGLNPRGHHLTSLLFHLVNSLLLFFTLERMTGALWRSAFVSALFAVHPAHVESVAWVAERKDVLSTFFWLLTILAYAYYARQPRIRLYLLVMVLLVLSLMAKPMAVTLPFVLLLLDFWPLERFSENGRPGGAPRFVWNLVWEKLPLLALSLASSVITFFAQRSGGAVASLQRVSLADRLSNALVSYIAYCWKMIWPASLVYFYPRTMLSAWQGAGSALLLVILTAAVVRLAGQYPYLLVGWLWFLGTLIPVIGLVQVGDQAMADRYTYLPFIGLFIAVTWGLDEIWSRLRRQRVLVASAAAVVVFALAVRTWYQVDYWRDSISLSEHAIREIPNNFVAHNNLGSVFDRDGRVDEALAEFSRALQIRPASAEAHNNLGATLAEKGRTDEAIAHYIEALRIQPDHIIASTNLGAEMARRGNIDEALRHLYDALNHDPENAKAHYNVGLILAAQGKTEQAIEHYRKAIESRPSHKDAHMNLGVALAQQGRLEQALSEYAEALRIDPDYADAHINMGIELASHGRMTEAVEHFSRAAAIQPSSAEAHYNLARAYLELGNRTASVEQYSILTKLDARLAAQLHDMLDQR